MKKIVSVSHPAFLSGTTVTAFCEAVIADGGVLVEHKATRSMEVPADIEGELIPTVAEAIFNEWLLPLLDD